MKTKSNSLIKILLVDDLPENLFSLELILSNKNYLCVKANSGNEALKILLYEQDFAIILMDVQMPEMDGFETVELIREIEILKHVPIIFLTASMDNPVHIFKGYQAGAVDYMIKPLNPELLQAKVGFFVELHLKTLELLVQNEQKEKQAEELRIANKELLFQNKEKENRAAELIIANKELAFQNEEKGKRAVELTIANKELEFQTLEKKKRVKENKELEVISNSVKQASLYSRSLIEASLDPLVTISPEGKITDVNEALVKVTGVPRLKLIGTDFSDYFTEPQKAREGYKQVFEKEFVSDYPLTIHHKNGKLIDVLYNASVYKDEKGNVLGVFAAARDVTAKKAEELSIANQELILQNNEKEKQAAVLEIANTELIFQNKEKENRAAELIIANEELAFQNEEKEKRAAELAIANEELAFQNKEKEKRAAELFIANKELVFQNKEKENRAAELIIANKELAFQNEEKENRASELFIANKELVFQNKEKENRAAELIIANKELAFQNEEKENRAAELIIANKELAFQNEEKEKRAEELTIAISELKHAEDDIRKLNDELEQKVAERTAQLEYVNKELGSFSYSVSHDLRAPIRAINGYTRILMEDYAEKFDSDGTKVLNSIIHNSKKMGQLIDDLLAFSKLGRKQVTVSKINMTALVKLIREELLFDEGENIPEFNVNALPSAQGDQSLIKQVWINLISNAIKYSKYKPKTTIEIGAYEKDNLVVYYIKDEGAGFDMQYYDKLFGVFQRLHSQEEFEGTGIGLAIVEKIVNRHSGTVWAESKLNEGTCFYFSLPNLNF
jgi:PAS domain S-box-containing protein